MIENLLYVIVGFAGTYISLELAWYFIARKIKDYDKITPIMLNEIRTVLMTSLQTRGGRIY
jgi:hypothetical protein